MKVINRCITLLILLTLLCLLIFGMYIFDTYNLWNIFI